VAQGLHFAILTELPSVCVCSVFAITSRSHHVRAERIYIILVAGVKSAHPIMQKARERRVAASHGCVYYARCAPQVIRRLALCAQSVSFCNLSYFKDERTKA
jgi:hypothetical protein